MDQVYLLVPGRQAGLVCGLQTCQLEAECSSWSCEQLMLLQLHRTDRKRFWHTASCWLDSAFETDSCAAADLVELQFGSAHRLIDLMVLQLRLNHLHQPAETHLSFIQTHRTLLNSTSWRVQICPLDFVGNDLKWSSRHLEHFSVMEWGIHKKQADTYIFEFMHSGPTLSLQQKNKRMSAKSRATAVGNLLIQIFSLLNYALLNIKLLNII